MHLLRALRIVFHSRNKLCKFFSFLHSLCTPTSVPWGISILWFNHNMLLTFIFSLLTNNLMCKSGIHTTVPNHFKIIIPSSKSASGRLHAPVKAIVALGRITPIFGRTQYLFGEVVLTWSKCSINNRYVFFIMSSNPSVN